MAQLGVNIHETHVGHGLSQEAVAYRAGLSRFTYRKYEQGETGRRESAN